MTTQQLVKTGIDEYAGGGGGGGGSISEDFASCSDWTTITGFSGGVVCSGGYGHGATNEADNQAYYSASSTGSPNHWVRVTSVEYPASGRSASLVVRSNGTTFYSIFFYGSTVTVARNDGNWDSSYDGGYTYGVGTFYDVKAEVSGTGASVNIKVYVGNMTTPVLDANDASAGRLTTGDYIGVGFARTSGDDPRVDNLTAGAL
jgi:hypothetical protein